jgi:diaminopimelate decarboxylase
MHWFHYRDGLLHCQDVDVTRVAQEFGTPLYIYSSAGMILDRYRRLDAALAPLDHLICYPVKANSIETQNCREGHPGPAELATP